MFVLFDSWLNLMCLNRILHPFNSINIIPAQKFTIPIQLGTFPTCLSRFPLNPHHPLPSQPSNLCTHFLCSIFQCVFQLFQLQTRHRAYLHAFVTFCRVASSSPGCFASAARNVNTRGKKKQREHYLIHSPPFHFHLDWKSRHSFPWKTAPPLSPLLDGRDDSLRWGGKCFFFQDEAN